MNSGTHPETVVALGGGHGLSVTLRSLLRLTPNVTGIAGVIDDGGSSGRLRDSFAILPPGDLRMALAAMIPETPRGQLWHHVLQHRFEGSDDLSGHAIGNLLLAALWSETNDVVAGLAALTEAAGAQGCVLPNALEPAVLTAHVTKPGEVGSEWVTGQSKISATQGFISDMQLIPGDPQPCAAAVQAILDADAIVLGPGSWFTSVLPHLLVPSIRAAIEESTARRILILNLADEAGEAQGFAPETYLDSWRRLLGEVELHDVIADTGFVSDRSTLNRAVQRLGARLHLADVAKESVHEEILLSKALGRLICSDHRRDSGPIHGVQG
ncbi:MAG: uridine diphosphate-N-acetylglucosamine-binding protein YvcK [Candidatus Nanopelagicales bacterium]|nr:uridine diphosphate-N-acetylglucosamine-binding protein YvcK [Candidatus Nanopelagicales bacterium]MDP4825965.1 uridine diphosphate-N-acetylglucosamine-binding protein YvcK [Candidatus Nanopelagicales bacterium]MDP4888825.1 uridine diphosphate-N-acetylglucosamine-binding protein YvcK [Candidatus Nanopelagicales bacterium]